jgi:hypothetical protein
VCCQCEARQDSGHDFWIGRIRAKWLEPAERTRGILAAILRSYILDPFRTVAALQTLREGGRERLVVAGPACRAEDRFGRQLDIHGGEPLERCGLVPHEPGLRVG